MSINLSDNKEYIIHDISMDPSIFNRYYEDNEIDVEVLKKLSRELGISYDLYKILYNISEQAAHTLIQSMSTQSNHEKVSLLVDRERKLVLGYSLETERTPLLNTDFINRVKSLVEANDFLEIKDTYYDKEDTISSMIIKRTSPFVMTEHYTDKPDKSTEYDIGILIINNELSTTSTRLVVYIDGQPLYLPANYYNVTTSRFRRSTSNSIESLEVLMLKIIDDLREDSALSQKISEFHYNYRYNKNIRYSYEEYNTVLKVMRKLPAVIEDNDLIAPLLQTYESFSELYSSLEDQKSSYIWRCTALSVNSIKSLISITAGILSNIYAPASEVFAIRELLGYYISTPRIVEEIAREDVQ